MEGAYDQRGSFKELERKMTRIYYVLYILETDIWNLRYKLRKKYIDNVILTRDIEENRNGGKQRANDLV